jgi:hypothetical protein
MSVRQSKILRLWMMIQFMTTMCHHTQKGRWKGVIPICVIGMIIKMEMNRNCSLVTITTSARHKSLEMIRLRPTTVCTRTERTPRFTQPPSRLKPQKLQDPLPRPLTLEAQRTAFLQHLKSLESIKNRRLVAPKRL